MIPLTDQSLRNLSQRILVTLLPEFSSEYAMSDAASLALLMNAIADELAEGIQRRLEDIVEMQTILSGCVTTGVERDIVERTLESYTLKAVNERHDELTKLLVIWHEKSESDDALAALNADIWHYLRHHANRHAITAIP